MSDQKHLPPRPVSTRPPRVYPSTFTIGTPPNTHVVRTQNGVKVYTPGK